MMKDFWNYTSVAYIILNCLHIIANVLQFFFSYVLMDNLFQFEHVHTQWEAGKTANVNMGITLMAFACVMMVLIIFNLTIIGRYDMYTTVWLILVFMILVYFILMCICAAYFSTWGRSFVAKSFGFEKCFIEFYHMNDPAEACYCNQAFLIVIIWWELTLQSCLIFATLLLEKYVLWGITPGGCCGVYDEEIIYYEPAPPGIIYSPFPPPANIYVPYPPAMAPPGYYQPAPPYQSPSQYNAQQEQNPQQYGIVPAQQGTVQQNVQEVPQAVSRRPISFANNPRLRQQWFGQLRVVAPQQVPGQQRFSQSRSQEVNQPPYPVQPEQQNTAPAQGTPRQN